MKMEGNRIDITCYMQRTFSDKFCHFLNQKMEISFSSINQLILLYCWKSWEKRKKNITSQKMKKKKHGYKHVRL